LGIWGGWGKIDILETIRMKWKAVGGNGKNTEMTIKEGGGNSKERGGVRKDRSRQERRRAVHWGSFTRTCQWECVGANHLTGEGRSNKEGKGEGW